MGMDNVKPGLSAELDVEVTAAMTINRTGRDGADVLSTPLNTATGWRAASGFPRCSAPSWRAPSSR